MGAFFGFFRKLEKWTFCFANFSIKKVPEKNEEHYDKANEKFFKIVISDF